jgi:hypothetical protein
VRPIFLALMVALPLCGCGWFGNKDTDPPPAAGPARTSDEILQTDCNDPQWKQQNLGLWYSVCRQPMRW